MSTLTWDPVGGRTYETGVDHGVLYIPDGGGAYSNGVAWNGLTTVTESPSGAAATPMFADNMKYLNLIGLEEFGGTIEAYTYPDEWQQFDGMSVPEPGVTIGQQARKPFGLSYRTKIGSDLDGDEHGYKLHLVYGATAAPSAKAYKAINDTPEAIAFSWVFTTVAAAVTGHRATSLLTLDSTKVDATALAALQAFLYGTSGSNPSLPTPDAVLALFAGTVTAVTPTAPSYNSTTHVITIPTVAGVTYYDGSTAVPAGARPAITATKIISARPNTGYMFHDADDSDWEYVYP